MPNNTVSKRFRQRVSTSSSPAVVEARAQLSSLDTTPIRTQMAVYRLEIFERREGSAASIPTFRLRFLAENDPEAIATARAIFQENGLSRSRQLRLHRGDRLVYVFPEPEGC